MAVMVKAKKTESVVPDGVYQAVLSGVKTFSNSFGERVGFEFELTSGQAKGAVLMRSTSTSLVSNKGRLYEVLAGLLGRDLTAQEIEGGLDVEELVGTCCNVLVKKSTNQQGQTYSNIQQVFQAQ